MGDRPNNRSVIETLVEKMHPTRLKVSGKFTAILAFILNQQGWTDPAITGMVQTSSGGLLVSTTRDPLMNEFVGDAEDLDRNLAGAAGVVGLDEKEMRLLMQLRKTRIRRA